MWTKILIISVVAAAVPLLYVVKNAGAISGSEARKLVDGGARLVDVRTPGEFSAGHIEGAINLPLSELERRLAELGATSTTIVLYCRSGTRSGRAKRILESRGFARVSNLGGMHRW